MEDQINDKETNQTKNEINEFVSKFYILDWDIDEYQSDVEISDNVISYTISFPANLNDEYDDQLLKISKRFFNENDTSDDNYLINDLQVKITATYRAVIYENAFDNLTFEKSSDVIATLDKLSVNLIQFNQIDENQHRLTTREIDHYITTEFSENNQICYYDSLSKAIFVLETDY